MYHERGIRQADIAASLHISQAKVSRLLKRAAELGIVRTIVVVSQGVHTDLEEQLEQRFGLLEAVVVDVDPDSDEGDVVSALGSVAASHLEATLSGGDRIGISSWSQTLLAMVDRMRPFSLRAADDVVQLLGGIGSPEVQSQSHRLLNELARVLGANPVFVQAPGLVADRGLRDALMADALADVRRRWAGLTMALVGIGAIEPSELLTESGNAFSAEDRQRLLRLGAVGNVCHHYFTAGGEHVHGDLEDRTVTIPVPDFMAIPRRVGIAGGAAKREAVHAAVVGGWVNVLVTDHLTATALLERPPAGG
ncbi:MarR family transcriptional regulator [Auraticoccus sp. F435]|uniref:MarR family transcriptional regulator n=2 Tax=Auraticoccus cholistanensis TaxID=2656650 RepID=A0A6A9USY3_9ACTN|nr:sugar-binding domain-containing protein [Auraticoccus cholistanensis]MVA74684.1 MarR family transcriptional regulator [Auraticoccus cholistanensis]